MISSQEIEACISQMEANPLMFENSIQAWIKWQPQLAAFLFSDTFKLLNEDEKEILLFGASVIFEIAQKHHPKLALITEDKISIQEEVNWELLENANGRTVSEKLDIFFDDYPETELLAFIEDLCSADLDEGISQVASDINIIALKTICDLLFTQQDHYKEAEDK